MRKRIFLSLVYVLPLVALLSCTGLARSEDSIVVKGAIPTAAEARGVDPSKFYPGECYVRAWTYVLSHPTVGARLVHGAVRLPQSGEVVGHAWVLLPGNKVFDPVEQMFLDKSDYYQKTAAVEARLYSYDEAKSNFVRYGHPGPWLLN